jgi:hypothetical protein
LTATRLLLLELLAFTGPRVAELFGSLDPDGPAQFAVAWAGESHSANWFDIGREYTERWRHQQQIREAVGAEDLTARRWLHPALDLFVRALPHTYRAVAAAQGEAVVLQIEGEAGGA